MICAKIWLHCLQVLKELELERKVALSLKLDSNEVPQLVEHNPVIAFEVGHMSTRCRSNPSVAMRNF